MNKIEINYFVYCLNLFRLRDGRIADGNVENIRRIVEKYKKDSLIKAELGKVLLFSTQTIR